MPWIYLFVWGGKIGCHWFCSTSLYWLLLLGGIIQSVPCNCDHLLIYCAPCLRSNHSRFIHQSSLLWLQQKHIVAKRRETGLEMTVNFSYELSLSHLKRSLTCRKIFRPGTDGVIPFRRKTCCGFVSPLKTHLPRPGLNPRTLGPMASRITITQPRTTCSVTFLLTCLRYALLLCLCVCVRPSICLCTPSPQ
jgi:hypothetical protein